MKYCIKIILSLVLITSCNNPCTGSYTSTIELVQSWPQGTEKILQYPGIRYTADVWVDMINHAKKSIAIGAFYFNGGSALQPVVNALTNAAKKGITVRIVADKKLYGENAQVLDQLSKIQNICIHLIDMNALTGGVMHAKYMIIDNNEIFVGSQNYDNIALKQVREIGIRVRNGQLANVFTALFEIDWGLSTPLNCTDKGVKKNLSQPLPNLPKTIQITPTINLYPAFSPSKLSYPNMKSELDTIVSLINGAKKEVNVQVMTYQTSVYGSKEKFVTLQNALIKAAKRKKMKVRLLIANWSIKSDALFKQTMNPLHNAGVEIKISTIPQLKKCIPFARVEHAKYMTVDTNKLWIGTGNWEHAYFEQSRDIGLAITSNELAGTAKNLFMRDWNGPYTQKYNPKNKYQAPNYQCK